MKELDDAQISLDDCAMREILISDCVSCMRKTLDELENKALAPNSVLYETAGVLKMQIMAFMRLLIKKECE